MASTERNLHNPHLASDRRRPGGRRRAVLVAGVAGGVGTSTLAFALRAVDRGVSTGTAVDVLVCRATGDSLIRAAGTAHLMTAGTGQPPVLAVTALDGHGPGRALAARIRLVEPHVRTVVLVPHVRRWRDIESPFDELRAALTPSAHHRLRHLRRYLVAVDDIRAAVGATSGAAARTISPLASSSYRPAIPRTSTTPRRYR
jgi:hypothetical protein